MADEHFAFVNYFARVGYTHQLLAVCSRYLKTEPHDRLLHFWQVFGMMKDGSSKALAELNILHDQHELELAVIVCKLYWYRTDRVKVQELLAAMDVVEEESIDKNLLLAATVAWHLGGSQNIHTAKKFAERVLGMQPQCLQAQSLYGWILLAATDDMSHPDSLNLVATAQKIFNEVLQVKLSNLDALLGKAHCFELTEDYEKALCELDEVITVHPWFLPGLCEKGRIAMLMQHWDMMQEISDEILKKDPEDIDGLRLKVMVETCNETRKGMAASVVTELLKSLERREPKNANIFFKFSQPIARVAGRGALNVLNKTIAMVERAQKYDPDNALYILELAHQLFLSGDFTAAISSYRIASQRAEVQTEALCGVIQCLLIIGSIEDAEKQLNLVIVSSGNSPILSYLKAQLCWLKSKSSYSACKDLLGRTIDHQLKTMRRKHDYHYYTELNSDRLLGIAQLYIEIHRHDPKSLSDDRSLLLSKAVTVLEIVLAAAPGYVNAQVLLAYTFHEFGDLDGAHESLQTILTLDPTCASAHNLLAQIHVEQGEYDAAKECLQQAFNDDFLTRESVWYHILQAQILIHDMQYEEALLVLEAALALPGIKQASKPKLVYYVTGCKLYMEVSCQSRTSVYLLLAKVHTHMKHHKEVTKAIEDAKSALTGTEEEAQVLIASCDALLASGDIEAAISLLQEVPCESIYFVQAKIAMADIYLKYKHDKSLYCRCYSELAELFPNAKTNVMFGDALMKIHEPLRAIKAYEAAWKNIPKDASIIRKIGKALESSHEYEKAVEHYETAVPKIARPSAALHIFYNLAELCFNLKQFTKMEVVVREIIDKVEATRGDSKLLLMSLLLLFNSQSIQKKYHPASEAVVKLKGFLRQPGTLTKSQLTDFCYRFSQVCEKEKDMDNAVLFLNEALKATPSYAPANLCFAKLHFSRGELHECESKCGALLRCDPYNTEGSDMLIHVFLQREMYDSAVIHFQQILQRQPNYYPLLSQFMILLWRLGRVDECESYIKRAENATTGTHMHAGLAYCKGLLAQYLNNPNSALEVLNSVRSDSVWGKPALYLMIEIYMSADEELVLEEEVSDGLSLNRDNISIAQRLLSESRYKDEQAIVWECYIQMATRQKSEVEVALGRLNEMAATKKKDDIEIMLCIATGLIILKQIAKAKAQLRKIDRLTYKWDDGHHFERTWLLLANIHVQGGKMEIGEQMCKKCLKYNKGSWRAWEWIGVIMEKGNAFIEATNAYENAWRLQKECWPSVGYKLAFIYLKTKRYINAILICHKVLQLAPHYPKIRKDVLDKARRCLRP